MAGRSRVSSNQPALFDRVNFEPVPAPAAVAARALGELAKVEGMQRALDAAAEWRDQAIAWVAALPAGATVTADDIIAACGLPRADAGANMNNAVGAAVSGCARRGLLVSTDRYVTSARPERHAGMVRVWRRSEGNLS